MVFVVAAGCYGHFIGLLASYTSTTVIVDVNYISTKPYKALDNPEP